MSIYKADGSQPSVITENAEVLHEGISKIRDVPKEFYEDAKTIVKNVESELGKYKISALGKKNGSDLEDTKGFQKSVKRHEKLLKGKNIFGKASKVLSFSWNITSLPEKIYSDSQIYNSCYKYMKGFEPALIPKGIKKLFSERYLFKRLNEDCLMVAQLGIIYTTVTANYVSYTYRSGVSLKFIAANDNEKTLKALRLKESADMDESLDEGFQSTVYKLGKSTEKMKKRLEDDMDNMKAQRKMNRHIDKVSQEVKDSGDYDSNNAKALVRASKAAVSAAEKHGGSGDVAARAYNASIRHQREHPEQYKESAIFESIELI